MSDTNKVQEEMPQGVQTTTPQRVLFLEGAKVRCVIKDSSQILAAHFDEETKEAILEFKSKEGTSRYSYSNFDRDLFMKMITADSVGKFFASNIKKSPETYVVAKLG